MKRLKTGVENSTGGGAGDCSGGVVSEGAERMRGRRGGIDGGSVAGETGGVEEWFAEKGVRLFRDDGARLEGSGGRAGPGTDGPAREKEAPPRRNGAR
mmetsp:Transcript_26396/g.40851  ORF Transcript_26396/g.40851 Transcript_26396/m.40851 type:complete len:98 (+) Transcript_26396:270-563(+)